MNHDMNQWDTIDWLRWRLRYHTNPYLANLPLYIERGHCVPEKLDLTKESKRIEETIIQALRTEDYDGLTDVERVWGDYLMAWVELSKARRNDDATHYESYHSRFRAIARERDNLLVELGLPPYDETYYQEAK